MKPICLIVFFLLSSLIHPLRAQKMFWNDMTIDDKEHAIEIAVKFMETIQSASYENIRKLISEDMIYAGNGQWLNSHEGIPDLDKLSNAVDFSESEPYAYTFDEFLDNHTHNALISKCYEVFDNHSVLVVFNFVRNGKIEDCLLSIKKNRNTKWEIQGIIGLFPAADTTVFVDKGLFREEKINDIGISIPIPNEFNISDHIDGQTIFYYEGKSGRDAAFQIMIDELKAKIYYYTYKFVEHNNQQFNMSDLIVKYVPSGIKYEYEVIDPSSGTSNKGITVGIERSGQVILVQYYSFLNVYTRIKFQVDYTLSNIKL